MFSHLDPWNPLLFPKGIFLSTRQLLLGVLVCCGHSLRVCSLNMRIQCRCIAKLVCRPHLLTLPVVFSWDISTASWWLGGVLSGWSRWWCFCMFLVLVAQGRAGVCVARTARRNVGVLDIPLEPDGSNALGFQRGPNIKSSPCSSCSTMWPEMLPEMCLGWSSADGSCCHISVDFKRSSQPTCVVAVESKDGQPDTVHQ